MLVSLQKYVYCPFKPLSQLAKAAHDGIMNWEREKKVVQSMEEDKEYGVQFESGPVHVQQEESDEEEQRGGIQFESVQQERRKRGKGNLS